ncbi:MAG: helix-turn-helix transcriptional regulator [Leptospiraceae bacterium]|nr:helix-turn-helix transcriptional regulator [Leptospiraceae bacterium]
MKLSELIQKRLKELNISKAELARRVNVSRAYIGDLANGTARTKSGNYILSPEVTKRLADALHVPVEQVLSAMGYDVNCIRDLNGIFIHNLNGAIVYDLNGIKVQFDQKKFSKAEQEKILDILRLLIRGLKFM